MVFVFTIHANIIPYPRDLSSAAYPRNLTNAAPRCILRHKDAAYIGGRLVTTPKGGDAMYFVVTFHILGHSVSIRIQKLKSRNRHSAK